MKDCQVGFEQNQIDPDKIISNAKCPLGPEKPFGVLNCNNNGLVDQQADQQQEWMKLKCEGVEGCILAQPRLRRKKLLGWA